MVKKQPIQQIEDPEPMSQLARFTLGFEYDKTLQQIKHDVRTRTHNLKA